MKWRLFILLFSLAIAIANTSVAQSIDPKVDSCIQSLQSNSIDTIIYYEPCQIWAVRDWRSEEIGDPSYLLWINNGKTYFQKFGHRYTDFKFFLSLPIILDASRINDFLQNNIEACISEEIQPAIVRWEMDSGSVYTVWSSHSCIRTFDFYLKKGKWRKVIPENALQETFNDKYRNLNYDFNRNTKLRLLKEIVTSEVQAMENKNSFICDEAAPNIACSKGVLWARQPWLL